MHALPEDVRDSREGWDRVPNFEAARLLNVSRQRVAQLIAAGSLPDDRNGREYIMRRAAVEAMAAKSGSE